MKRVKLIEVKLNPNNPIIILATSNFEFYYFDFIKQFNLKFDVIINNKEQTAFWLNEF